MLPLPFFMLDCWNFYHRPLAWSLSKHSGQSFFKSMFDHFWPLCNIKKFNFANFHARELIFSKHPLPALFQKHSGQMFFKLTFEYFWPLCNIKNANITIFRMLTFLPQTPCLLFFKKMVKKNNWLFTVFDHCVI